MTEQADTRESQMVVIERDADGKPTIWCDPEVAPLVAALNAAGIRTIASCSGHGLRPASIALADGRELIIAKDFEEARKVDSVFPGINGEPVEPPATDKDSLSVRPVERVEQEAEDREAAATLECIKLLDDVFAPNPQPAAPAPDEWVSVAERMPEAGVKVLAFYCNSLGVSRRICAEYVGKYQRDAVDFDSDYGDTDYDETTDQYYWPEGWYERVDNWDELTHLAVTEGEVTHWRPIPDPPAVATHQRKEGV